MYAIAFAIVLLIVLLYTQRYTEAYNSGEDVFNGEPKLDSAIVYYPGTHGFSVKAGGAPTAKSCYEWSKRNGVNHWGWRKNDKSCFNYADPTILTVLRYREDVQNVGNVKIGCTEPGVKVINGCMDWSKGDIVWGRLGNYYDTRTRLLSNYMSSNGVSYAKISTIEDCRAAAEDLEYDAFVYATNRGDETIPATCFAVYKNSLDLYDFLGGKIGSELFDDYRYITGCTDPEKKVRLGCR